MAQPYHEAVQAAQPSLQLLPAQPAPDAAGAQRSEHLLVREGVQRGQGHAQHRGHLLEVPRLRECSATHQQVDLGVTGVTGQRPTLTRDVMVT